MSVEEFRIGELVEQIRGLSYKKENVLSEPEPGYVPVLRANNIGENFQIIYNDLLYLPEYLIKEEQFLREGDILIAASSGSLKVVGKGARFKGKRKCSFGAFCKVIRPVSNRVLSDYIGHYFQSQRYRTAISNLAIGANILNIRNRDINELKVIAPNDLTTQRQIVIALDKARTLIDMRQESLLWLNRLIKNTFLHRFQQYIITDKNDFQVLGDIAEVTSGITKGRKTKETNLIEVPYLRVANVQDGYFDLSEIKTIQALAAEIEKYSIQKGDLFLTEGGDPDKLGRGDVWMDERTDFIFQNHLYRVRINDRNEYLPSFLNALTGSDFGKSYFLKQAKQTTGIATINSRQLKAFPVPIVPINEQIAFEKEVAQIKSMRKRLEEDVLPELELLFQSMLQRAFHGDITVGSDLQLDGLLESQNFQAIENDATLVKTLVDRFNDLKSVGSETEEEYNRSKDALFHLLKVDKVTQEIVDESGQPFKTRLKIQ